ncbi:MAG: hypothetical protein WAN53_00780 [Candidatus Bathyarchaeia archaeon]
MSSKPSKRQLKGFLKSKRALAIPVTYLLLFVSLMAIISMTYSFAVVKINSRGALLRASVAKQNMQFLDDAVHSVAWSFSASEVVYMDNCGGIFKTENTAKNLALNFTDEQTFYSVLFNSPVGRMYYKLDDSEFNEDGSYIRGDDRAVINQTAFTMTQLYVMTADDAKQLVLSYRPLATAAAIGTSGGKPLNLIRVNVINVNSSANLSQQEKFYLKVTSVNVTTTKTRYEFNQSVSSLAIKSAFDGKETTVWLPISSISDGVVVDVEIDVCYITIQRAEV